MSSRQPATRRPLTAGRVPEAIASPALRPSSGPAARATVCARIHAPGHRGRGAFPCTSVLWALCGGRARAQPVQRQRVLRSSSRAGATPRAGAQRNAADLSRGTGAGADRLGVPLLLTQIIQPHPHERDGFRRVLRGCAGCVWHDASGEERRGEGSPRGRAPPKILPHDHAAENQARSTKEDSQPGPHKGLRLDGAIRQRRGAVALG